MYENLRQRAYLNSLASWINSGVTIIVGFLLQPFLVSTLGAMLFGVWQIIRQLNGYMVMGDIRSATTLKWIVSKNRTTSSANELRQAVTASLITNIVFLPLYIAGGILIVWLAPYIANVDPDYYSIVRISSALLVVSFILSQFFFLFESVLTGMNISYKAIGVSPFATILGGVLMAGALALGFGLPGLASSSIVVSLIIGLLMLRLVVVNVPWFGFARISSKEVLRFTKLTGWFMASKIVRTFNISSDIILLGYFASPVFVTTYTMSRYLMVSLAGFVNSAFNAVVPGLNRLVGEKSFELLFEARNQIITYLWVVLSAIGGTICLWNRPFISIWTNPEYFAGQIETYLIVVIAIFQAVITVDASILFMALEARKNVIIGGVSAFMTLAIASLLIPHYHTLGLLLSILLGSTAMAIGYAYHAAKIIIKPTKLIIKTTYFSRAPLFCIIFLAVCAWLGTYLESSGWIIIITGMAFSLLILSIILFFGAMTKKNRKFLFDNFSKISIFKLK